MLPLMNTILFDLDGTLLPMDMEIFMKEYFKAICIKCKNIMEPAKFTESIWRSTEYMIRCKDKEKTNMTAFMEDFKTRIPVELEEINPILEDFYMNEFKKLKAVANPNQVVREIIENLKVKGYNLVIATNPLFPRQAILHRIEWAGLDPKDFILITDYETMHYCKPQLEYYMEILTIIDKTPLECLMVGNDVQEDLAAEQLNIKTFLVTDHIINRNSYEARADHRGDYNELLQYVKQLPFL